MYNRQHWDQCRLCPLHKDRFRVVHYRGDIPADVLYIGEAPGFAEDVYGIPFVSTAGDYLNWIVRVVHASYPDIGECITNTVACISKDHENPGKIRPPTYEEAFACSDRLEELILTVDPKVIVLVGDIAREHVTDCLELSGVEVCSIMHPIGIMRRPRDEHAWRLADAAATVISALDFYEGSHNG